MFFAIAFFLLHDLYERQDKKIDALSVVMSLVAIGTFMYGLNEITRQLVISLILMAAAVVVIVLFIHRQDTLSHPLLDLSAFKVKAFSFGEILMMLAYMGSLFLGLLAPLLLEGVGGYTPFAAGLMLAAPIACYAAACFLGGFIGKAHGVWPLVPVGFLLTAAGLVAMFFASSYDAVVAFLVFVGIAYAGIGILFPIIKSADLEMLPRNIASSGSSIHSTLVQIAGSISSALLVGIMSSDVDRLIADGTSKAVAYSQGFSHTLLIGIGILAVAAAASFFYARLIVKLQGSKV